MSKTIASTLLPFSVNEQQDLDANFGIDAEYYEQDGQTFVVQFTDDPSGPTMCESFPVERDGSKLKSSGTPTNEFDWEAAEAFRGEAFPS